MSNASKIMYKIGRIFNIIAVIGLAIGFVASLISTIVGVSQMDFENPSEEALAALSLGITGIVVCFLYLVFSVVALIIVGKAIKALKDNTRNVREHVTAIVVGVISGEIFYVLGGIFGLVAESQQPVQAE